jgi:trimeric autotransporter adhesin
MLPMSAIKPAPTVTRRVSRSAIPRPRIEEGPSRSASAPARQPATSPEPEPVQETTSEPVTDRQPGPGAVAGAVLSRASAADHVTDPWEPAEANEARDSGSDTRTDVAGADPIAVSPAHESLQASPAAVDEPDSASRVREARGPSAPLRRLRPAGPARMVAPKAKPPAGLHAMPASGSSTIPATTSDDRVARLRTDVATPHAPDIGGRVARDPAGPPSVVQSAPRTNEAGQGSALARKRPGVGAGANPAASPPATREKVSRDPTSTRVATESDAKGGGARSESAPASASDVTDAALVARRVARTGEAEGGSVLSSMESGTDTGTGPAASSAPVRGSVSRDAPARARDAGETVPAVETGPTTGGVDRGSVLARKGLDAAAGRRSSSSPADATEGGAATPESHVATRSVAPDAASAAGVVQSTRGTGGANGGSALARNMPREPLAAEDTEEPEGKAVDAPALASDEAGVAPAVRRVARTGEAEGGSVVARKESGADTGTGPAASSSRVHGSVSRDASAADGPDTGGVDAPAAVPLVQTAPTTGRGDSVLARKVPGAEAGTSRADPSGSPHRSVSPDTRPAGAVDEPGAEDVRAAAGLEAAPGGGPSPAPARVSDGAGAAPVVRTAAGTGEADGGSVLARKGPGVGAETTRDRPSAVPLRKLSSDTSPARASDEPEPRPTNSPAGFDAAAGGGSSPARVSDAAGAAPVLQTAATTGGVEGGSVLARRGSDVGAGAGADAPSVLPPGDVSRDASAERSADEREAKAADSAARLDAATGRGSSPAPARASDEKAAPENHVATRSVARHSADPALARKGSRADAEANPAASTSAGSGEASRVASSPGGAGESDARSADAPTELRAAAQVTINGEPPAAPDAPQPVAARGVARIAPRVAQPAPTTSTEPDAAGSAQGGPTVDAPAAGTVPRTNTALMHMRSEVAGPSVGLVEGSVDVPPEVGASAAGVLSRVSALSADARPGTNASSPAAAPRVSRSALASPRRSLDVSSPQSGASRDSLSRSPSGARSTSQSETRPAVAAAPPADVDPVITARPDGGDRPSVRRSDPQPAKTPTASRAEDTGARQPVGMPPASEPATASGVSTASRLARATVGIAAPESVTRRSVVRVARQPSPPINARGIPAPEPDGRRPPGRERTADHRLRRSLQGDEPRGVGPSSPGIAPVLSGSLRPLVRASARATASRSPSALNAPAAVAPARVTNDPGLRPEPAQDAGVALFAPNGGSDRPSGPALARATGGAHEIDGTGRSTVVFPQPPGRATTVANHSIGAHIARTIELDPAAFNGDVPWAPPGSSADTSTDDGEGFDELYDRVLSRLRRDLIVERERRGDLTGPFFRP